MSAPEPVLRISDLSVTFETPDGPVAAVRGVDVSVEAGECVAVVGESGSGKSQTFLAVMGLLASNGRTEGSARFKGTELIGLKPRALNQVRGEKMTMIFQDPLTSLTPHMRIGDQMREVLHAHSDLRGETAARTCVEWLERVRISEAARRLKQYPHELSGGMRQRVMIAMSMLCEPELLIADEPTTALDVTVQAEVLDIMDELKRETRMGLVLITHDMGVVARMADRVQVMKDGGYVEDGVAEDVFAKPRTDYARQLLAAAPRVDRPERAGAPALVPPPAADAPAVLAVDDAQVWFPVQVEGEGIFRPTKPLKAVDGVSFTLRRGETLGLVGESGCGKSTLARFALRLVAATGGRAAWIGKDAGALKGEELRAARADMQIVFQDPLASLNPRMTVGGSIAEPLELHAPELDKPARMAKVRAIMAEVELDPSLINRYPHELSGGQNQRVGIARAMILDPQVVVCDEAVSALDVSVQAQVLRLLADLQRSHALAMLFISHDLSVVREISHRVMVLYLGRVVELADRDAIYKDPRHPYTRALIDAVPVPDPVIEKSRVRERLVGDLPSPMDPTAHLRWLASKADAGGPDTPYRPQLLEVADGHWVAEHDPA